MLPDNICLLVFNDLRVFEVTYLTEVNQNVELFIENKVLNYVLKRLKCTGSVLTTVPGKREYLIHLKMYLVKQEKVFDYSEVMRLIQFRSAS